MLKMANNNNVFANQNQLENLATPKNSPVKKPITPKSMNNPANPPNNNPVYLQIKLSFIVVFYFD